MKTAISPALILLMLAASLSAPAHAADGDDASGSLNAYWQQQMDRTEDAIEAQRPEAEGAVASAEAEVAQEGRESSDAQVRKELSRSKLQDEIMSADALTRWGFIVPEQKIEPRLAWYDKVPVFGDPGFGSVKFDVLYKGARRHLSCELDTDEKSHTVEVKFCEPDLFGRGWPKGLYVDHNDGIHFDSDPKEPNRLVFYVDFSSIVPLR